MTHAIVCRCLLAYPCTCSDSSLSRGGSRSDGSICGRRAPELIAAGRKIISSLASGINGQPVVLAQQFPNRITADGRHIRMSGTLMSAPMVTGAVALLLQRHPA